MSLLAALTGGGFTPPSCPVCAVHHRTRSEPVPRAETLVMGTLVCAECAERLARGLESLPLILAELTDG